MRYDMGKAAGSSHGVKVDGLGNFMVSEGCPRGSLKSRFDFSEGLRIEGGNAQEPIRSRRGSSIEYFSTCLLSYGKKFHVLYLLLLFPPFPISLAWTSPVMFFFLLSHTIRGVFYRYIYLLSCPLCWPLVPTSSYIGRLTAISRSSIFFSPF